MTAARIFIVARVLLGFLLFWYWWDLFLDRRSVFLLFQRENVEVIVSGFGLAGSLLSLLLMVGVGRRWVSGLLCALLLAFIYMSPFVANVSLGYLSFILLFMCFIPSGESWSQDNLWEVPREYMWALWFVTGFSYVESAFDKINNPVWFSGKAVSQLLNYSLAARANFVTDFLRSQPELMTFLNWGVIVGEIVFSFFFLFRRTRIWGWSFLVLMHLGILMTMGIYYISYGMIVFHLFMLANLDFVGWRRRVLA